MGYGHYGHGMGWELSPAGWVLMILFCIALLAVIVFGVALLVRLLRRPAHSPDAMSAQVGPPPEPAAQRILDERFARGEIDTEEYRQRGAELRGPR